MHFGKVYLGKPHFTLCSWKTHGLLETWVMKDAASTKSFNGFPSEVHVCQLFGQLFKFSSWICNEAFSFIYWTSMGRHKSSWKRTLLVQFCLKLEMGHFLTQAYFWATVNMRPTHLRAEYFSTQPDEIFLTGIEKSEKFGIFRGNFPNPKVAHLTWPEQPIKGSRLTVPVKSVFMVKWKAGNVCLYPKSGFSEDQD